MRVLLFLSLSLALLTTGCDDLLDRVSTKRPAPTRSTGNVVDSGRVSIRGDLTGSEGDPIHLTAVVTNPRGDLEYAWSMNGRGSLMSREADPQNAVVRASTSGRLDVTVTVTEDGDEIGSAMVTLQITD